MKRKGRKEAGYEEPEQEPQAPLGGEVCVEPFIGATLLEVLYQFL